MADFSWSNSVPPIQTGINGQTSANAPFTGLGSNGEMLAGSLHGLLSDTKAIMQATGDVMKNLETAVDRMTKMLGGNLAGQAMSGFVGESIYGSGSGTKGMPVYITNFGDLAMPEGNWSGSEDVPYIDPMDTDGGRIAAGGVHADRDHAGESRDRREAARKAKRKKDEIERQQLAAQNARNISLSQGRKLGQAGRYNHQSGISLGQLAGHIATRMGPVAETNAGGQFMQTALGAHSKGQGILSSVHQGYNAYRTAQSAGIPAPRNTANVPDLAGTTAGESIASEGVGVAATDVAAGAAATGGEAAAAGGAAMLGVDAIPGLGEVAMAATALFGAVEGIGGMVAAIRAQGAQYQSIEGGSNLQGLVEAGRQRAYEFSQTGVFSGSQASALFTGVTQTGMVGGERANALQFARTNYLGMGMDPKDSLKYINLAAQNASLNLNQVSAALQGVSDVAAVTHANTNLARQAMLTQLTGALTVSGGASAPTIAASATNYIQSMGRDVSSAGIGIDLSSQSSQARQMAMLNQAGYHFANFGDYQAAIAKDPTIVAKAQELVQNQVIANSNPAAVAALQGFAAPQHGGEYRNVEGGSAMGQALLRATPGGLNTMISQLQQAGYTNINASTPESAVLTTYANMVGGKTTGLGEVGMNTQHYIQSKATANAAADQAAWFRSHGGGSSLIGITKSNSWWNPFAGTHQEYQADPSPMGRFLEAVRQNQIKTGVKNGGGIEIGGHHYGSITELEKNKADLQEAEAGHYKFDVTKAISSKGLDGSGGNANKKAARLMIGMTPGLASWLTVASSQSSADLSLQPPVGNNMNPGA